MALPKQNPLPLAAPAAPRALTPLRPRGGRERAAPPALWLAARLPDFACEVFVDPGAQAFVVVAGEGSQVTVVAGNAAARARGVQPGQRLSAALALEPALLVRSREASRELAALDRLATWAGRFSPCVVSESPDTLLLEVRGSLRLFGGLAALSGQVQAGLRALGYQAELGVAPLPRAASWLARAGWRTPVLDTTALAGVLGELPLAALGWDAALLTRLEGVGVHRVRDVLRLPRADFARRYGQAPLRLLDQALGRVPDPRLPHSAPPSFTATLDLPCESEGTRLVELALERLVGELGGLLLARGLAVEHLDIHLQHRAPPETVFGLGLLAPSRDGAHLLALLRERLARLALPGPVRAVGLTAGRLVPLAARASQLFATPQAAEAQATLLERLAARLGAGRVCGLASVAEHRPERAWTRCAPGAARALAAGPPRPLWLLAVPEPLSVSSAGRPRWRGPLRLLSGPERIESGWWDGVDVARDYFVAATASGRRAWVYRERRAPHAWHLHGWFG